MHPNPLKNRKSTPAITKPAARDMHFRWAPPRASEMNGHDGRCQCASSQLFPTPLSTTSGTFPASGEISVFFVSPTQLHVPLAQSSAP